MLIKNFVPRYHCSQLSIRPCPLEFLIAYMYIYIIYTLIKVPSTTRNSVAGPIMRTSANNFATHRTIRDMHRIRCWTRNPGRKGFSPRSLPPSLIAFHSTDKGAALNIKVILFLLFALLVALSRGNERNFRFGYKLEKRKWR